jgi:methyl-accepting chemotaxis protein
MTYDPNRPSTSYGSTEREFERTAENLKDQAQGTIENVKDKVQDVAGDVKDRAQQVSSQVADRADAATTTVGEQMSNMAQTIRDKAPTSGPVADAAGTAAQTLERAGSYLQQQDLTDIRADLEGIIRRHPMESLLIGLGIGYLLARSTRR